MFSCRNQKSQSDVWFSPSKCMEGHQCLSRDSAILRDMSGSSIEKMTVVSKNVIIDL